MHGAKLVDPKNMASVTDPRLHKQTWPRRHASDVDRNQNHQWREQWQEKQSQNHIHEAFPPRMPTRGDEDLRFHRRILTLANGYLKFQGGVSYDHLLSVPINTRGNVDMRCVASIPLNLPPDRLAMHLTPAFQSSRVNRIIDTTSTNLPIALFCQT